MSKKIPSIGIVGAGLGGLSLCNALLKRGFTKIKIFDQAKGFLPTSGAGFGFSPNGQLCLSSIGIDYQHILHPFDSLTRLDLEGNEKASSRVFENLRTKYNVGFAGCLRADLVQVLSKPLAEHLHYSHRLDNIFESKDGKKVHLQFDNGTEKEFDIVVGADGINSRVATKLKIDQIDPGHPVYSGANIFYGVISDPDNVAFEHPILQGSDNKVVQGPGTGEFITFRAGPEDRKVQIWANTYVADTPPNGNGSSEWGYAQNKTIDISDVLDQYQSTHPIHELASVTLEDRLLHFGLFYRRHKQKWCNGSRVTLIGDACHATLPYIGQGANQAIEDAIVLADCLERKEHPEACEEFYTARSRRTKRMVRMAGILDKLYHSRNPIMQGALDLILTSVTKGGLVYKQLEKEIVEECPVDYRDYASKSC